MTFPKRNGHSAMRPDGFEGMLTRFSGSPVLSNLRDSLTRAVGEYKAAYEAVGRIAGDKTLTDGARLVRQATVARSKMAAALAALENARTQTAAGRKTVEAALGKPLDFSSSNLAEISLATEMRAHVKNLATEERTKFMRAAMDDMDLTTLRAIAAAPAFLSGVPAQFHEFARDKFLEVVAPEHVATRQTLVEGEAAAETLHSHLAQATANLVDFDSADMVAKTAAA